MRTQRLLELARHDERVGRALRIFGQGDVRWPDLYHAFEMVQGDVGNMLHEQGWATREDVTTFTRTVNSPEAIGEAARHGVQRYEPPENPMSYDDARRLVTQIVSRWLDYKVGQARPS